MATNSTCSSTVIPAKRFGFTDNQNVIPIQNFYGTDYADVLNGQIPGSNTAQSSLTNLTGILNTQTPGTNLISTALDGVASIGNAISSTIGDITSVVGNVINDVGQLINDVASTICGIASAVISDAFSIVNSVVGGVTGAISSVFGSVLSSIPLLQSLSPTCLEGLFKGPIGIGGNLGNLCGGLNSKCGGGVLGALVTQLTCNTDLSSSLSSNPLTTALQSNFLSNLGQSALSSLGVNNLMSGMSNCSSNPFSLPAMNGLAFSTLSNYSNTTSMLDFGNVSSASELGSNLPTLGSMVPNSISNFTNNFTTPASPVYNAINNTLTPLSITGSGITTAFSAINPTWNTSSTDGIPSIENLLSDSNNSNSNLTDTDTYNYLNATTQETSMSGADMLDSLNWGTTNTSIANNPLVNTTMSMSSPVVNRTQSDSSTVDSIFGSGSSSPSTLTPTQQAMNQIFGSGSSSISNTQEMPNTGPVITNLTIKNVNGQTSTPTNNQYTQSQQAIYSVFGGGTATRSTNGTTTTTTYTPAQQSIISALGTGSSPSNSMGSGSTPDSGLF